MNHLSTADLLSTRVAELDSGWPPTSGSIADSRLLRFSAVMTTWTASRVAAESTRSPALDAEMADLMTSRCALLRDLSKSEPHLVRGPLSQNRQHWILAQTSVSPQDNAVPSEASFVGPERAVTNPASTQPHGLGIYTSTAAADGHGMWRTFLEFGSEASLHRRPWVVWHVQPEPRGVVVLDIDGARSWRAFVEKYPRAAGGYLYPDWPRVAAEFDAVHITLAAIAATQGFALAASPYPVAPAYWDVETTLWLRWCFTSVTQVEVVA